jgi:hypothetical protein
MFIIQFIQYIKYAYLSDSSSARESANGVFVNVHIRSYYVREVHDMSSNAGTCWNKHLILNQTKLKKALG